MTYDLRTDYRALGYGEEETAEFDSEITIVAIHDALAALGYMPDRIGGVRRLCERLVGGDRWDCVFNICEGLKGASREAQVPALLEAYDVPYVFSDPLSLSLALDKGFAKRVVRDCGLPTAPFAVMEKPEDAADVRLDFPLFVKPVAEGSGKGIGAYSKVNGRSELQRVAAELLRRFAQPVMAESWLPGREFTVGITGAGSGAEILGVVEVVANEKAAPHGYGYENKEHFEDRIEYRPVQDREAQKAGDVALAAWRALRCRDGGRVDVRSTAAGQPQFIEVNPLAGLNPQRSDLVFIARYSGLSYAELIGRIMAAFHRRHRELTVPRRN